MRHMWALSVWCTLHTHGMCMCASPHCVIPLCFPPLPIGATHWQSPNYFPWFPGNTSAPGILAEMLMAALNMVGFSWQSSPVSTELEMVRRGEGWRDTGKGGKAGD